MIGKAKEIFICGKLIKLGDYVEVRYKNGDRVRGEITGLWSPELSEGHLQARVKSGWCFHDTDTIIKHQANCLRKEKQDEVKNN